MELMSMKTVVVIGGGPAGMMAAGVAAKKGADVILMEKKDRCGRKLFITGKGRCNVTNNTDPESLIANTPGNPYFLYSAYYGFSSQDTMAFFEQLGVKLKTERGNRVFPVSDKSGDIVRALERFVKDNGVDIRLDTRVDGLIAEGDKVVGVKVKGKTVACDSVVIATGGLSYPVTGSDGDGFRFAKSVGHSVTKLYPSLVPLKTKEKWVADVMGLSLKNVRLTVKIDGKQAYSDFGEMLFTHYGISGPLVLTASRYVTDKTDRKIEVYIDLKPALGEKELDTRLLKDFAKYANKDFKNALDDLLPLKLIPVIIGLSGISPEKKVNSITKEERQRLLKLLKALPLTVTGTSGYNEAVVTTGGVEVDEIDPSTMESKLIKGLYFAGEVIDVDAFTGGFNLQIAFATGYLAGTNC
jgi:hypothetical protein